MSITDKACRDAGIYDVAIREIESRIEMLEHRITQAREAYSRIHGNESAHISAHLVWAVNDAASLAEYVDGVRRRVADPMSDGGRCLSNAGGYGRCELAPGHGGRHRDANGDEFPAVQS